MDRWTFDIAYKERGSVKMKKTWYLLYILIGVALIISGFATTERGLKENNREVIYKVADDYAALGNIGFPGFNPLDYKIAFSSGKKDIVVSYDDGKCNYEERTAVYDGLAGTALPNGDEWEVLVPEYDTWVTLETIENEPLSVVIWHEGFHAYQFTYHKLGDKVSGEILTETALAEAVDNDSELKRLYSKELEVLSRINSEENYGDAREIAVEYTKIAAERRKLLSDQAFSSEKYFEMVEGTAYYVESKAIQYENGQDSYEKKYLNNAGEYTNGNAKYYRHGMLECMLLDKLDPEWKTTYSFDKPLCDLILEKIS